MELYTLHVSPYYDNIKECYKNVITINKRPSGKLNHLVKQKKITALSPFQQYSPCYLSSCNSSCMYIIHDPDDINCILSVEDISKLYTFLLQNGYKIDTDLTNMTTLNPFVNINTSHTIPKKLLCFISYNNL